MVLQCSLPIGNVFFHFKLLLQKFNKESILQEFPLNADEKVIAVYKRPYPFFWHERYGDERRNQEPESPEGIQITTRPQKLSNQCELGSHTVLDGCMVLTNQALYKCRPRYEPPFKFIVDLDYFTVECIKTCQGFVCKGFYSFVRSAAGVTFIYLNFQ